MSQPWPAVRFDEILERVVRKFVIDDTEAYRCVGVRWYGLGAFIRQRLLAVEIARKEQWRIETGDIVYNKLFAWKGAFAVADETINGCIVSDKFPTYRADTGRVDLRWLKWYFRTSEIARQAQDLSKGAAAISKLTLNPPDFWNLTVPLPPLDEQRRIVARIEELAAKIDEARGLRRQATDEAGALAGSSITLALEGIRPDGCLGDILLEKPKNGWSARCDNAETGIPVLSLGAVTGFRYREREFKRTSEPTSVLAHYWVRDGDLLITRSNTPELVGHAAIYNGSPSPCIYPDLMMRLIIDERLADKRFVHCWLRSFPVREYIGRSAKGTSPTMKKLSQGAVTNIPFPLRLSLPEQRQIVTYLGDLEAKVDAAIQFQTKTAAELDAMLPSILNRAISGEL